VVNPVDDFLFAHGLLLSSTKVAEMDFSFLP